MKAHRNKELYHTTHVHSLDSASIIQIQYLNLEVAKHTQAKWNFNPNHTYAF